MLQETNDTFFAIDTVERRRGATAQRGLIQQLLALNLNFYMTDPIVGRLRRWRKSKIIGTVEATNRWLNLG